MSSSERMRKKKHPRNIIIKLTFSVLEHGREMILALRTAREHSQLGLRNLEL